MKVCFNTFGCRLNRAEALEMEAKYLAAGYKLTDKHSDADVIVLRGCSVTARAQHDCEKAIAHIKRHYPLKKLIVLGCLPKSLLTPAKIAPVVESEKPVTPSRTARAYLKIQNGCSGKCTFCIVPSFRGNPVSADYCETLDKARAYIDSDYHEIVVTGCNLSLYASRGKRLCHLLDNLCGLSPNCRIRVGSIEPSKAAQELINLMAERPNLCRFLHLSIQSGSEKTLSAMRRPYTAKEVNSLVSAALEMSSEIALGCDILTGFPGESDMDFSATKGLIQRYPFSNVHAFPYSERPGTIAAGLPNAIPPIVRSARAHEISELVIHKRSEFARKFIGKVVEIIVEDEKEHAGWTGEYLWCKTSSAIANDKLPKRKGKLRLKVTKAQHGQLTGVPQ